MELKKPLTVFHLALAQGEIVGFLGPNGAGKSTTMKNIEWLHSSNFWQRKYFGYGCCKRATQNKTTCRVICLNLIPCTMKCISRNIYSLMQIFTKLKMPKRPSNML